MKTKLTLIPLSLAAATAYVVFHPGVAFAEPRFLGEKPQAIQTGDYTVDPQHGGISFEITHLGLSQVHGRFNTFSGKIHEDDKNLGKSSVEFTIKSESIDTAVPPRDVHLRNKDFFEVEKYPELTFKSTRVAKAKNGYIVVGDLTIKGKSKSITIPFKHLGPSTLKGFGDQPARIGIVADPITIKRSDFGLSTTEPLPDGTIGVSNEVIVRISLEATLDKAPK